MFFAIVYASIGALQVYESIYILTKGGPGDATRSMSINIVEEAFGSFQIGYGASVAVHVMTVLILIITGIQLFGVGAGWSGTEEARDGHPRPPPAGSDPRHHRGDDRARHLHACCRSPGNDLDVVPLGG